MDSAYDLRAAGPVSEMAIVDTFTKLIFGERDTFSSSEESIIQSFRLVDHRVALDSHEDMGAYLRALGVAEMIRLVSKVQTCMAGGQQALTRVSKETILDRRAH